MSNKTFDPKEPVLMFEFASVEAARHFKLWLCESGEQSYWDWMEYREQEEKGPITGIGFDYHKGAQIRVTCGRLDR